MPVGDARHTRREIQLMSVLVTRPIFSLSEILICRVSIGISTKCLILSYTLDKYSTLGSTVVGVSSELVTACDSRTSRKTKNLVMQS